MQCLDYLSTFYLADVSLVAELQQLAQIFCLPWCSLDIKQKTMTFQMQRDDLEQENVLIQLENLEAITTLSTTILQHSELT